MDKSTFLQQSQRWFKCLNNFFYQCFTKIRSQKRKHEPSKVDKLLEERKKLRRLSAEDTFQYYKKIQNIEEEVRKITNWQDADHIWDKFQQVADSDNSASTQAMWKWKKQLFPKIKPAPPMGVKNNKGEVKTRSQDIISIYENDYNTD